MNRRDPSGVPAAVKARFESDPWAHALGVEYEEISPGYCRVALTLQPHMLNYRHGELWGLRLGADPATRGAAQGALDKRS